MRFITTKDISIDNNFIHLNKEYIQEGYSSVRVGLYSRHNNKILFDYSVGHGIEISLKCDDCEEQVKKEVVEIINKDIQERNTIFAY